MYTGKPENSWDSLCCSICCIIVVWNWTHSVYEISQCLEIFQTLQILEACRKTHWLLSRCWRPYPCSLSSQYIFLISHYMSAWLTAWPSSQFILDLNVFCSSSALWISTFRGDFHPRWTSWKFSHMHAVLSPLLPFISNLCIPSIGYLGPTHTLAYFTLFLPQVKSHSKAPIYVWP